MCAIVTLNNHHVRQRQTTLPKTTTMNRAYAKSIYNTYRSVITTNLRYWFSFTCFGKNICFLNNALFNSKGATIE